MSQSIKGLYGVGHYLPEGIRLILSLAILIYILYQLATIITNNLNDVIITAPRYQDNFKAILHNIDQKFHIKLLVYFNDFFDSISLKSMLLNFYSIFTTITSNALLIALYMSFLFLEQRVMRLKLKALFPQKGHYDLASKIIGQIASDTRTYIGIKSLMSLTTSVASWLIMKMVGLDFAEFWALLIFFLNFIPNIGSIIATLFPAILAFIQFQDSSWWPFIFITSGIMVVQFIVGNIIEPRYLGNSLNLSPFVILIALAIWGQLWGILGLFLSVPITVMMMIIFSHFEKTQGIAILLSQDGSIRRG